MPGKGELVFLGIPKEEVKQMSKTIPFKKTNKPTPKLLTEIRLVPAVNEASKQEQGSAGDLQKAFLNETGHEEPSWAPWGGV